MMQDDDGWVVVKRECEGWLATTRPPCPFRIGVTAETEYAAIFELRQSLLRWEEILYERPARYPNGPW